jgi:hypothetical protein
VQAADTLLGRLLDRLRATGAYDDALVVVTADHGISFELDQPSRGAAADQYEQVMWTPLLVKAPGQTAGRVDDRDVESIDLLPLVAAELGVDLPWAVDGRDPRRGGGPDRRRAVAGQKELLDWPANALDARADDEELLVVDGAEGFRRVLATDLVPGQGPAALWSTAPHGDLVGRSVDELDPGPPAPVELVVDGSGRFDDVDLGRPLPLELTGHVAGPEGGAPTLAIAVEGTVAGTTSLDGVGVAGRPWRVLLWPDAFVDGRNRIEAYLVTGPPNHERLRSVTWRSP